VNGGLTGVPGTTAGRPVSGVRSGMPAERTGTSNNGFAAEFRRQLEAVQFSRHALQRMESRGISWGPQESAKLSGAVGALASKGGRTSLVLLNDLALVVSVPHRTVITAVPGSEQAVFTNIDSAIRV